MKESRKCDSLRVAFKDVNFLLRDVIKNNLNMFKQLEDEQAKRRELQKKIDQANKELNKISSKKKNKWIYGTVGVLVGVLTGIAISN